MEKPTTIKPTTIKRYVPLILTVLGLVMFGSCPIISPAQFVSDNIIRFNRFSQKNGLSQNTFTSIIQDRKGYLWFGTYTGLIKYDGYSFTTFHPDPFDKKSLPDNEVHILCEDGKGDIWIAGAAGLSKYDPHSGNFISYQHDSKDRFSLPAETVNSLIKDARGRIWIGTDNGLCFYDSALDKFIKLTDLNKKDTLCGKNIRCLMLDHKGLIWIGTNTGINIYDPDRKKLELFNPPDKNYSAVKKEVLCLLEDHSGNIWISLLWAISGKRGIYKYSPQTGGSKVYSHSAGDPGSPGNAAVNTLVEDNHNTIWGGTYEGGLYAYKPTTDRFEIYRSDAADQNALNSDQVVSLFEDRSGVLWIGTNGGGLNNVYLENKKFGIYQNFDKEYISHYPINLYKDHSGNIFLSALGKGISEFDPVSGRFKSYKFSLPNGEITGFNFCYGMVEASDSNLWVVSFDEGLHTLNLKLGKFTTIHSTIDNKDTTFHNQSNCIVEDGNKRLWIGTQNGLKYYELRTKAFLGVENLYPDEIQLSREVIVSLYCDKSGLLWIAGTKGLITLNTKTGVVRHFTHDAGNSGSISNDVVNCFYEDKNDPSKIWIGTNGGGLNEFDRNTEKFRAFTMRDGLPDNSVMGVLCDNRGNLWVSTNNGISRFTPPKSQNDKAEMSQSDKAIFRNYNMGDGLPGNEFYYNTAVQGDDGRLYFAGNAGLISFIPGELKDNVFQPPIVITDFSVNNRSVSSDDSTGILKQSPDDAREVKLAYRQNDFSFSFAALSFIHPEKNQYAYKLEGYDKDWIFTDAAARFAKYTNISPGRYTFRVKASNNDGIWNDNAASMGVIITPPFWVTWWFRMLVVIAIASIIYSIYNYRIQELLRLENIRNKISADLHDDIGSTLNSISIYSEIAMQDQSKQAHALEMIGEASRKVIDSMSDIVWTINPENDSFEDIILRMRSLAFNLFRAKNIEFVFKADESLNNMKISMENRRSLFLLFKEAVNNLIKYAGASKVFIHLYREGGLIKLIVDDDGVGFDTSQLSNGNGLNSMKRRATQMNGVLNIISAFGKGTRIELTIRP